jgi:formylmethanofuran:tetrahydromethanopterin formyltransferase
MSNTLKIGRLKHIYLVHIVLDGINFDAVRQSANADEVVDVAVVYNGVLKKFTHREFAAKLGFSEEV